MTSREERRVSNVQDAWTKFYEENPNRDPNNGDWFKKLSHEKRKLEVKQTNALFSEWRKTHAPHLEIDHLANQAILDLAAGKRRESTELAVRVILTENTIYSIKDDKNPEMWVYDQGVYIPNAQAIIEERARKIYEQAYTTAICNEIIAKIRADTYIELTDFFDQEPLNKICVENGIINLETFELEKHTDSELHFTKLPITYNPDAECPAILQHLRAVIKHEEDLTVIQEIFGWCLRKEYKPEKAIMLLGTGRNGKGKTIDLMKRFLGSQNVSGVALQDFDQRPFCIAELHKKLANIGSDLGKHALKETGRFKNLTGGDFVTADRKHRQMIHFTNYAKMIFAANQLPLTYDISHAFFARWIIIDFPFRFYPKEEIKQLSKEDQQHAKIRDVDIIDKISTEQELSGLLNWSLIGFQRLKKQGSFSYSKNTEDVSKLWIRKSDSFAAFCMDMIAERWDGSIQKRELRREYSIYCRAHRVEMVSDKMIKRYLAETYGASEDRENDAVRTQVWKGIGFVHGRDERDEHGFLTSSVLPTKLLSGKIASTAYNASKHTTDSASCEYETLDIDLVYSEIANKSVDNEAYLLEKFGEEKIDYWLRTGQLFRSRPGTLKVGR